MSATSDSNQPGCRIGCYGLLQLMLIGMWLADIGKVKDWPWYAVIAPTLLSLALLGLWLVGAVAVGVVGSQRRKRRWKKLDGARRIR